MTEDKRGAEDQQDLNEQRLIRRAKLKELQEEGQDPFQATRYGVTHHSLDIKEQYEGLSLIHISSPFSSSPTPSSWPPSIAGRRLPS